MHENHASIVALHRLKTFFKKSADTFASTQIELFSKLYDYALIPAHCSTAFAESGIFPYDPRAVKKDKIIKHALPSTTTP